MRTAGYFDIGNFLNQLFYATFDIFSTAKKLVKNSKKMNGKCFRSEMKNLFSRLGTRVKASAILPYIQHTFIQNVFQLASDDSKDLLDAAYDDAIDSVSVAEDELTVLGSDIVEDTSNSSLCFIEKL